MFFDFSKKLYFLSDYFEEHDGKGYTFEQIKKMVKKEFKLSEKDFIFRIVFTDKDVKPGRIIITWEQAQNNWLIWKIVRKQIIHEEE